MNALPNTARTTPTGVRSVLAGLIHTAAQSGRGIGCTVCVGNVRGKVIGYNIARQGPFPGERFPLLIETELGTGKFALDEVGAV